MSQLQFMKLEYQIAQKLHGATEPSSRRAHDLIDLQLILSKSEIDLAKTYAICQRLFAFRRTQTWPPVMVKGRDWDSIYNEEKGNAPSSQPLTKPSSGRTTSSTVSPLRLDTDHIRR